MELGHHPCYGTNNHKHVVMPTDLANTVEITHGIVTGLERPLKYVRVLAQEHRDDETYYAPFAARRLPEGCDLHLGVVHHDNRYGDRRCIATASTVACDFGIATK